MTSKLAELQQKYPDAVSWAFGDSAQMADELAALVMQGKKTASCSALQAFQQDADAPAIGSYSIILSGSRQPLCVIRTVALRLVRFCDVTDDLARKEGEGDLSLAFWRQEHQAFFTRAGSYTEEMELVFEEFQLVEVC